MEIKPITATIIIDGVKKELPLLKNIKDKCDNFVKGIVNGNIIKSHNDYCEIIKRIETCSELNYYFLSYLKKNNIKYIYEGEEWDYKKNLEILEETLTNEQYFALEKTERPNPLDEIRNILKEFITIGYSEIKKRPYKYSKLKKKYPIKFIKLNYPLFNGIERLRARYYRDLAIEKNISATCVNLKSYIQIMEQDKEIFNDSLDTYDFNPKIYLLILTLTTTFNIKNKEIICNFFTKNINDTDNNGNYDNIKLIEGKEYLVQTFYEKRIIIGDDYILKGLEKDIMNYGDYPLEILLLRNESYQKFQKDGGKGFLYKLGLYNSFIEYIKYFIKSKALNDALKQNKNYENIKMLLENDNYLNEMLSENHFRFLPLYGTYKHFGYTNKDLMISFINSIPEITEHIEIKVEEKDILKDENQINEEENEDKDENKKNKEDKDMIIEEEGENEIIGEEEKKYLENQIKNLTNISLLFSIGVKFITSLHEFIIHLMYGYIYYFSEGKIETVSFKEGGDDDGGVTFEKILNGGTKFECLNINYIVYLLDGVSCGKDLEEFQKDLHSEVDIKKINDRIKNGEVKGFLAEFIKKYPINFDYIKDSSSQPKVFCRRSSEFRVIIDSAGPDTYGVRKANKK